MMSKQSKLNYFKPETIISNAIGTNGRYQVLVALLVYLSTFSVKWHNLFEIIVKPEVGDFRCVDPALSKCDEFCPRHTFNYALWENTFLYQWDLVCKKHYLIKYVEYITLSGTFLGNFLFPYMADRQGRKWVAAICAIIHCISGISAAFVPWLWLYIALRWMNNFTICGVILPAFSILMEITNSKHRPLVGVLFTLPTFAAHMALGLVGYLNRRWEQIQLIVSMPAVLLITYWFYLPESPRWLLLMSGKENVIHNLESAARINKRPTERIKEEVGECIMKQSIDINKTGNLLYLAHTRRMFIKTTVLCFNWAVLTFMYYGIIRYVGHSGTHLFWSIVIAGFMKVLGNGFACYMVGLLDRKYCLIVAHIVSFGPLFLMMTFSDQPQISLQIIGYISIIGDENGSIAATIPDKPVELKSFTKLCDQRRKYPVLYKLEFQTACKVETHSCRHATKKANYEKNQNQKCIPYDYNRVVLDTIEGEPDSDYVNASYVDSLLKPNAYIVTQGPTEETVTEFWRMVWQERACCIVMLTKTFDFIKVMCVQYWPASKEKHEEYGGIGVSIVQEEELANFHIRTFRLYKKEGDEIVEERTILQFHYTEWHSHTCPFANAILEFRRRVRAVVGTRIATDKVGPMIVHCNDGGGRSGVYLAIDANMELSEEEDAFDVFGYLKKLRQSRKGLIENMEQYKFVYDTLEEHIVCGNSWFPVSELSQRLKQKSLKSPVTKMNEYQREYQQICKMTPRFTIGDCAGGHRGDNREKNRDVLVVPPDNFRPYLTSFQGNSYTDYINAVFVDGYTKPREYIVTEWPLKHTPGEFWSLVYDYECSAVVVLCVPPHSSQTYPPFWPEGRHSKKYGPVFTIDHISHNHYTNIKTWVFRINKKIVSLTELMAGVKAPPKTVQLFQLTCWPMGHKVPTSTNSLVELMNMVERWRQRTDYGPVCVVSPDGRSRVGVYCAANACIEQVIQHGEVDIFQAVKTVRRHRPQLVENMTEYKYCYDLVLHYVLHYLNKDMKEKK